jgi:flagellar hook-length control protein FliK
MPFSPLDALMQAAKPPRPLDPPARHDGPGAFAPKLEQAYQSESPRNPPPLDRPKKPESSSPANEQGDREKPTEDAAASAVSADAADPQEDHPPVDEAIEDAVEISAEAAAAASAAQLARDVGQTQLGQPNSDAVDAHESASASASETGAPQSAAEAQQKQATATATATAVGSTEEAAVGEEASAEATIAVAAKPDAPTPTRPDQRRPHGERNDGNPDPRVAAGARSPLESSDAAQLPAPVADAADEELKIHAVNAVTATPTSDGGKTGRKRDAETSASGKREAAKQSAPPSEPAPATVPVAPVLPTDAVETLSPDAAGATAAPVAADGSASTSESTPRSAGAFERLLAGRSLKPSKEVSDSANMPTVDRARFVQRVERAMNAAQQRDGKIQVRLSPPDLGSLKIELAVQNGVMSAKLEAETPAARNLLLDSLPALRERLAQQNIQIEKFDVDVRQEGGGNNSGGMADDHAADQAAQRQNGRPRPTAARAVAVPAATTRDLAPASAAASGLDVRV